MARLQFRDIECVTEFCDFVYEKPAGRGPVSQWCVKNPRLWDMRCGDAQVNPKRMAPRQATEASRVYHANELIRVRPQRTQPFTGRLSRSSQDSGHRGRLR